MIKTTSLQKKLDVADRIAVNICMHQHVLEIDFPTSNIKLVTIDGRGGFYRWGAAAAILGTARA